jgi:hypothetical protein
MLATGAIAFQVREALELGNRRALWLRSAVGVPLVIVTCAALWLFIRDANVASHLPPSGFDPSWQCANYGRTNTDVCFKNKIQINQGETTPKRN